MTTHLTVGSPLPSCDFSPLKLRFECNLHGKIAMVGPVHLSVGQTTTNWLQWYRTDAPPIEKLQSHKAEKLAVIEINEVF